MTDYFAIIIAFLVGFAAGAVGIVVYKVHASIERKIDRIFANKYFFEKWVVRR